MTGASVLAIVAVLVASYFLITGTFVWRSAKRFKREARREATRRHWAEARNLLMAMARDGRLSTNSFTFRTFYALQTFILRRPDEYHEIARKLAITVIPDDQGAGEGDGDPAMEAWRNEVQHWPREMADVVKSMALGTGSLIFRHRAWSRNVPIFAFITWRVLKHLSVDLADHMLKRFPLLWSDKILQEARQNLDDLLAAC